MLNADDVFLASVGDNAVPLEEMMFPTSRMALNAVVNIAQYFHTTLSFGGIAIELLQRRLRFSGLAYL